MEQRKLVKRKNGWLSPKQIYLPTYIVYFHMCKGRERERDETFRYILVISAPTTPGLSCFISDLISCPSARMSVQLSEVGVLSKEKCEKSVIKRQILNFISNHFKVNN